VDYLKPVEPFWIVTFRVIVAPFRKLPRSESFAESSLTNLLDQLEMGPPARGRCASLLPADRRDAIGCGRLECRVIGQRSGNVGWTCSRKILRLVTDRSSLGALLRTLLRCAGGRLLFLGALRRLRSSAAISGRALVHLLDLQTASFSFMFWSCGHLRAGLSVEPGSTRLAPDRSRRLPAVGEWYPKSDLRTPQAWRVRQWEISMGTQSQSSPSNFSGKVSAIV